MSILPALLLCPLPLFAQENPGDKKELLPGDIALPEPGTPIEDRAVAKDRVERFKADWKAAGRDDGRRVELLGKLSEWDHPEILKVLAKQIKARSEPVAVAAILGSTRQASSYSKAGAACWGALGREKREAVRCALIIALGKTGYDKASARKEMEKLFKKTDGEERKAAARYFGFIRDRKVFRLLAEKLNEPSYSTNQPGVPMKESEKRRRWTRWNSNKPWIIWALGQIVPGETFETTDEARSWVETEGRAHKITW